VKSNHRIDRQSIDLGALSHNLPMDLAIGRHIDDDVIDDVRRATQPVTGT
jgi:hypothetical protein